MYSCNTAAIWSYISALKWLCVWYGRDDLSSAGRELGLVQSKGLQPTFKGVQGGNVNQMTQKKKVLGKTQTVLEKSCKFECPVSENHVNSCGRDYILSVCRDPCCDMISLHTFGHRTWTCIRLMASSADPIAAAKG